MQYTTQDIKSYNFVNNTPTAKAQELLVVMEITNAINSGKYDDFNDFYKRNINSNNKNNYDSFKKNFNLETVIKHFGNTLNEEDFIHIIDRLRELTNSKSKIDTENIKTTKIGENEFNVYKGADNETIVIKNQEKDKPIEQQLKNLQHTEQEFQTTNEKQNTTEMMNSLNKNIKEETNLKFINDIDTSKLNEEEMKIYVAAIQYQKDKNIIIKVDINNRIIKDPEDNILEISNENGFWYVKEEEKTEQKENTYQKKLTMPTPNNMA